MHIPEGIIFWDWNGTLLDDTNVCLSTMNNMLKQRNMPILSIKKYREIFGFPVVDYYRKVGFDFGKERFENLSIEFIDAYNSALVRASLANNAERVLDYFYSIGKRNVIVSAMEQDMLVKLVGDKGLKKYFTDMLGIDNIYAGSKVSIAINFVRSNNLSPVDILFIGDTLHDFEVAQQIGSRCILVADGHQTAERLNATGAEVVGTLSDLIPA
jgi:phosphoglycolate phosphatase